MDDTLNKTESVLDRALPERPTSYANHMLSGAGNYAMVAGVPYFGLEVYSRFKDKPMNKNMLVFSLACVGVGAAYGAVVCYKEACELTGYRNKLNNHVGAMADEIHVNRDKIQELQAKVDAHAQQHQR